MSFTIGDRFIFWFKIPCSIVIIPVGVQMLLFNFSCFTLVIFNTTFDGAIFAMDLPASEWTPKIVATGVAGVGQKKDLAVFTSDQALSYMRFGF